MMKKRKDSSNKKQQQSERSSHVNTLVTTRSMIEPSPSQDDEASIVSDLTRQTGDPISPPRHTSRNSNSNSNNAATATTTTTTTATTAFPWSLRTPQQQQQTLQQTQQQVHATSLLSGNHVFRTDTDTDHDEESDIEGIEQNESFLSANEEPTLTNSSSGEDPNQRGSFGKMHASSSTRTQLVSNVATTPRSRRRITGNGNRYSITSDSSSASSQSTSIDFLQDDRREMTWGRRIALTLMQYAWYNPALKQQQQSENDDSAEALAAKSVAPPTHSFVDNFSHQALQQLEPKQMEAYPFLQCRPETPSLEKAWAYFDHVALPRYILDDKDKDKVKKSCCRRVVRRFCKGDQQLQRAEPGEDHFPTKLYHPIWTPHKQLGDFGLGIGLYFSTLRAILVLVVLAGCLNAPNLQYFSSGSYSTDMQAGVRDLLKGSAICTDAVWVPCPDCNVSDFEANRIAIGTSSSSVSNITLALENACTVDFGLVGMINYGTLLLLLVGIVCMNVYLRHMECAFDEDEQTAQDYSIVIENPPPDATDPNEWRQFFREHFDAHVTACTVAVDNDLLVRSLVERREVLKRIEMQVEPGTSLDKLTLAGIAAKMERERRLVGRVMATLSPGIPELFGRLVVLTAKVQGLAQQDYPSTNVFVTFETEGDQRKVLGMYSSVAPCACNTAPCASGSGISEHMLFRNERLLRIREPDEPNTVRWQDLNEKLKERIKQQVLTLVATLASIALIAFIIQLIHERSTVFSAFAIAIFNSLFPMFAKALNSLEAHSSEGGKQRSLYCKIALFRWVNTAIVITIITPFTRTLTNSGGLVEQIYALFFAEIVTTNAIQLADPVGHLKRHLLAPRAATQDSMNLQFSGSELDLAERYTNMTKILFLTLWYCAIYPASFFMCGLALFINYFVDRWSLMRTWKRQPHLGTRMSIVSRRYFFSLAIVAMAILSSYYWSGFPFDNLCETNSTVSADTVGTWNVTSLDGAMHESLTIVPSDLDFEYCLQDFFRFPRGVRSFPFISEFQPVGQEWMEPDQATLTNLYGWTSVGVLAVVVLSFLWMLCKSFLRLFVRGAYKGTGEDQGINFSEVPSISSYVPQVESSVFSYPLLACNIDGIDDNLLEWTDPDRPYAYYDLTKDAEVLLRGTDISHKVVFSQIAHWPPAEEKTTDGD